MRRSECITALFTVESPDNEDGDFKDYLNPDSITVIKQAYIEPYLTDANRDSKYQFIRKGYYCLDKTPQRNTSYLTARFP